MGGLWGEPLPNVWMLQTLTSYTLPATVTTLYTHQLHISYTLLKITLTSYTNYTHQLHPHRHSDHIKYTPVTPSHTHQLHPLLNYIHQSHPSRHCDHNSYTISHSPVTPSLSPWQQYTISYILHSPVNYTFLPLPHTLKLHSQRSAPLSQITLIVHSLFTLLDLTSNQFYPKFCKVLIPLPDRLFAASAVFLFSEV